MKALLFSADVNAYNEWNLPFILKNDIRFFTLFGHPVVFVTDVKVAGLHGEALSKIEGKRLSQVSHTWPGESSL